MLIMIKLMVMTTAIVIMVVMMVSTVMVTMTMVMMTMVKTTTTIATTIIITAVATLKGIVLDCILSFTVGGLICCRTWCREQDGRESGQIGSAISGVAILL